MTLTAAQIREVVSEWMREYLSVEQNRRDAQSGMYSFAAFFVFLYIGSQGMVPSFLSIDRPGRAITIHFDLTPELVAADLAKTRLHDVKAARADGRTQPQKSPAKSERPPKLESITSMAASRPDYYGRQPILPPTRMDRPAVSDIPMRWQEKPARELDRSDRPTVGSASVAMPAPKIGTPTGDVDAVSEISFDVPVSGGSKGADFITLTSRTAPSSVGRPGGKEMSVRRPILRAPLPAVPEWFERKGLDSFVTLKILVSAEGRVESAEVEKTCGFKEMDAEARATILSWLFESTGYRESIVIKLNYRLR